MTEEGVTFRYENRRQEGAVYNVYAGADIVTAYGAKVYSKGDLVKANLTTDSNGATVLKNLHLGTYTIKEVQAPENFYNAGEEKTVTLSYAGQNVETVFSESTFVNDRQKAEVSVLKKDKDTLNPLDGGVFGMYAGSDIKNADGSVVVSKDLDNEEYVEQVTTYPTTTVHTSFFTDADGYLILPQNLKIGHYRIEEVTAPYGYTLNENYYEIAVDSDTAYQIDPVSGDVVIEVVYENHPVKGNLKIVKQGEVLDGFSKDFVYEVENLEGAVFDVYAEEDIYTADFQKDAEGDRILEYASGELVGTVTTDENGEAFLSDLPLGSYKIVEVTAPEGFVLNGEAQTVTFTYKDQNTPVIEQEAVFRNERQKVEVSVVKKDAETQATVAGAVFGLYANPGDRDSGGRCDWRRLLF